MGVSMESVGVVGVGGSHLVTGRAKGLPGRYGGKSAVHAAV